MTPQYQRTPHFFKSTNTTAPAGAQHQPSWHQRIHIIKRIKIVLLQLRMKMCRNFFLFFKKTESSESQVTIYFLYGNGNGKLT
jgi:hypothetical protein